MGKEQSATRHVQAQHMTNKLNVGAHWQETYDHDNSRLTVDWGPGDTKGRTGLINRNGSAGP
jgi:hypothetical protein